MSSFATRDRGIALLSRLWLLAITIVVNGGCYAPIHSPGIPAASLPPEFRTPVRTAGPPLNYSTLVGPQPPVYLLGPGDVVEVIAPDLVGPGDARLIPLQVLDGGEIALPRVGLVHVGNLTLAQAQEQINRALAQGYLQNPAATLTLVQKATINVVVLGAVASPGVHALPRYENDVAHALASAGGFSEDAGDVIEIHRQPLAGGPPPLAPQPAYPVPPSFGGNAPVPHVAPMQPVGGVSNGPGMSGVVPASHAVPNGAVPGGPVQPSAVGPYGTYRGTSHRLPQQRPAETPRKNAIITRGQSPDFGGWNDFAGSPLPMEATGGPVIRIPLRGAPPMMSPAEVVLQAGDVVVVPPRRDEVFYVVGPLSEQNRVRFSLGDRDREIGNGLLLPPDREVDVVTAVAMAGYIDPIESPTTVTVHRVGLDGLPMLIRVDLIAARYDPHETILVQPGDIIYLNPDHWWYTRRLIDRVIDRALGTAIGRWLTD